MKPVCRVLVLLLLAAPAPAAAGVAELSLDRGAIRDLIAVGLPAPRPLQVAGLALTLELDPPATVAFRDGGVEATIPFRLGLRPGSDGRLDGAGWSGRLDARFVPDVEPLSGTVRLLPKSVVARSPLPVAIDVSGWIDPVDLPRRMDWELDVGEEPAGVTSFVQAVEVGDERLRVELSVVLLGARGPAQR